MKTKNCSRCGTAFQCGSAGATGGCWCDRYPPIFTPDPQINCMCEACLHAASRSKIDAYVQDVLASGAGPGNLAAQLPKTEHLLEGIDYYMENECRVFTSWHHLRRGYCCEGDCRHCPYGFTKVKA